MVTDDNGCQDSACVTITEPPALTIAITSNNVSCYNACDGDATVTVGGGIPPYTYLWNDPSFQTTPIAINLCDGSYTVTVTDSNGCVTSGNVIITQPQELSMIVSDTTASTCGFQNGSACVTVIGGVSPFVIQWNDPDLTVGSCIDTVFAGVYNPIVTDANGCSFTTLVIIDDIIGPFITDASCGGTCDGTAIVFISSGTPPFTYVWQNSSGDTVGTNTDSISGLCGGTYTRTVIDANGCIETDAFTINAPATINSAIFPSNDVSCNGLCDGDATVSVSGGSPPYTYSWTNGDTVLLADT